MKKIILIFILIAPFFGMSQGVNCADMDPICTDVGASFTANTGTTAEAGNDYGCLGTQPNPSWYYFEVATNGNIDMSLTAPSDIDFIIWGPYADLTAAQANCGTLGGNEVDCSFSSTNNETPSIPGAIAGEVYIMLITNYANVTQNISLTQTGGTGSTDCSIVTNPPCFMSNFTATISACDPATTTYSVTGEIEFDDPPTTGDLVVEDCNGNIVVVASAPFTVNAAGEGTELYTLTGSDANGLACDVEAYFTADPTCSIDIAYTAPVCLCSFTSMSTNIQPCNTATGLFDITGELEFLSPPTTGTLTITDCNGNVDTYNAPFTSPQTFTLAGILPDGTTGCSVTAVFSADPGCTITSTTFDYPANCDCPVDAGSFTTSIVGSSTSPTYALCFGDQLVITPDGNFIPPADIGSQAGFTYNPGMWLMIYGCQPTIQAPGSFTTDPCYLGGWDNLNPAGPWTVDNIYGDNSTFYFVPLTFYDWAAGIYSYFWTGADCFDMGPAYPVTFLQPILSTIDEDCFAGTATVTLNGGAPSFNGSDFTVVPNSLLPTTATLVNSTAGEFGDIVIADLVDGDAYSFDVEDENGCPITINGVFTGLQDASFSYDFKYCIDEPNPSPIITGVAGGTFSSTAGLSINAGTGVINLGASTPGLYVITYESPAIDCWGTETFTVLINPLPIVVATEDSPICDDGVSAITLGETGGEATEWLWTTSGSATFDFDTLQGPIVSDAVDGETFTVTAIDAGTGCANTDFVSVTVNPLDDPTFTTTDFCVGSPNAATLSGTGTPGGTYSFDTPPAFGETINAGTGEITGGQAGTIYSIQYLTNGACPDSLVVPVTVNPLPNVTTSDETICLGGSIDITASGAATYVWSPATNLNTTIGATVTSTPTADISYTVTGTDANGCVNTAVSNVTVLGNAPINAGLDVVICVGESTTLTATGGVTYTWDNGLGAGNNFVVSPVVTTTYIVNGTDASGCTGVDQMVVTVNPLPVVSAGVDQVVCVGTSVTLSGSGASTYVWDNGITDGVAFTPIVGNVNYTVTGTDANGCENTDVVNVIVNPLPTIDAGIDQVICIGAAVTLTATGASTYVWDNGITNGVAFNPIATTTYTVTGTDVNGCINTDNVIVTVNPLPVVNAGVDQTICVGASVILSGSGATSYVWNNGVTDGTSFTPTVGNVTYTVTGTDANGCVNTDDVIVNVNPLPVVGAGLDQTVCDGASVTLTGSGATSYVWDNGITDGIAFTPSVGSIDYTVTGTDGNGCVNTDIINVTVNPLPVVGAGLDQIVCDGASVTLSGSGATSYVWDNGVADGVAFTPAVGSITYTVTGTDGNGCVNTDQVDVTVNPLPVVNAGVDQIVCDGASVTLSGSGATSYVWDNGITDGVSFTPVVGTITYTVTGTDGNGCVNTDQVDVTVNPNPSPIINGANSYCTGTFSTLSTSIPYTTYSWSTGDVTATTDVTIADNPITVTVTDANGCSATSAVFTVIENTVINYNSSITICQGESATIHGNLETVAGVYSETFILGTGCDSVANVTLVVNPLPIVGAGLDQIFCIGGNATLTGSGATSYVWDNGITNAASFTPAVGTITYTVTGTDANGCVNTDQVDVTVNPLPVVDAGVNQIVCEGTAVTLSGTGATSYVWNNSVVDGIAFTPGVGTVTYTVTGTDANGCVNTDQVDVTVNPLPVVGAGVNQVVCEGSSVTLVGSGATTYVWDNSITNNVAFTPGVGTVTYTVTGTDANGCVNTDQVDVTVNPLPVVGAGLDIEICVGATVTLSGSGANTYAWDNSVTDGTSFVPTVGTTTYTVTGTDANGCVSTDHIEVIVNPLPIVGAGTDVVVCFGTDVTLSGTGADTYVWNNGITDGLAFTPPNGLTTYMVTGTDANGCTNTDQVDVTVNPLPVVDAGTDVVVCVGESVTLSGSGATSYVWDNGITDGVAFTPVVGTLTYTVTGTDVNGCVNTDQVDVTVNPLPIVDAGLDQIVCDGASITLSGSGATSYVWDNGITDGVAFTPVVGTLTYTVTGTDGNGCVNTDQVDVTVNPLPIVGAGLDQVVCDGVAVVLNGSGADTYVWDNGVTDNVAFTPAVGTITYTVTGTDANGCVNTDQVDVTVTPLPNVFAGNDIILCAGDDVILTGSGATSYVWDNGVTNGVAFIPTSGVYTVTGTDINGCVATDVVTLTVEDLPVVSADIVTQPCEPFSVVLTSTSTSTGTISDCVWQINNGAVLNGCGPLTYTFANAGTFDVTLTTTTDNGCSASITYIDIIHFEESPIASFNPVNSVISNIDTEVQFTNTSSNADSYYWDFGDLSSSSSVVNPIHSFPGDESGIYTVMLVATSSVGCVDTTYGTVQVEEELIYYVPNTFTPDDDSHNPTFKPIFTSGFDPLDYELLIFDRWGEIVFESHNAEFGWDGSYAFSGKIAQDGTYTWKIIFKTTASDERKMIVGHVNIIR